MQRRFFKENDGAKSRRLLRDRSQTLVRGSWCKKGALKIFDPCKGGPEKITTEFPLKIEFTCFSMGLTRNFHGKKGGLWNFFAVWRGPRKIFAINIFCIRPLLTSVCERSLTSAIFHQRFLKPCIQKNTRVLIQLNISISYMIFLSTTGI